MLTQFYTKPLAVLVPSDQKGSCPNSHTFLNKSLLQNSSLYNSSIFFWQSRSKPSCLDIHLFKTWPPAKARSRNGSMAHNLVLMRFYNKSLLRINPSPNQPLRDKNATKGKSKKNYSQLVCLNQLLSSGQNRQVAARIRLPVQNFFYSGEAATRHPFSKAIVQKLFFSRKERKQVFLKAI